MRFLSLRTVLLVLLFVLLAVNVGWRVVHRSARAAEERETGQTPSEQEPSTSLAGANILPSLSNLASMGRQWQRRIEALPPEQRAPEQARLDREKDFFASLWRLPATERRVKVRERLEMLMNDPLIQAEWAAERHRMIAQLASEKRRKIFKDYVQNKEKLKAP